MTNLFADEGGLIIAVDFKPKVMEKYKNKSNITPVICDVTKEKQVDMAYLTLFLASDESKYITGQSTLIDGGRYVTSFFYL